MITDKSGNTIEDWSYYLERHGTDRDDPELHALRCVLALALADLKERGLLR